MSDEQPAKPRGPIDIWIGWFLNTGKPLPDILTRIVLAMAPLLFAASLYDWLSEGGIYRLVAAPAVLLIVVDTVCLHRLFWAATLGFLMGDENEQKMAFSTLAITLVLFALSAILLFVAGFFVPEP